MKRFLSLSIIAGAALSLSAADTNTVAKIGATDAANHYDETLVVTGKVVEVNVRPGITFINLDKPHPDSPFTCVIFPSATNQFPDIKSIKGSSIAVSGKIKNYHDKPEIILDSSNQLTVVAPPAATATAK
jgi:DNA/RNA endonuclease YhcR with UshA esterase domain